jgi:hypothetical protein
MFKISIVDTPSQRTLLAEGTSSEPGLPNFAQPVEMQAGLRGAQLVVDLTNVTVISREGENALFDPMKKGVNFSSGSVLTRHVLNQLVRKKQQELPRR